MALKRDKLPYQILGYSLLVYLLGLILLIIAAIFNIFSYAIAWGWLLGAAITTFNYLSIFFQTKRIQQRVEASITSPYRGQGYSVGRFVLSGLGMLATVFIKANDQEIFNLFSLFAAYLVISIVIFITGAQLKAAKVSS
jgi:hypothetical protein